jgi:hypothetical protein
LHRRNYRITLPKRRCSVVVIQLSSDFSDISGQAAISADLIIKEMNIRENRATLIMY